MYICICYYHTSRGKKGKLANTTQRDVHDNYEEDGDEHAASEEDVSK